jgi:LysM repeat protein
MIFSVSVFRRLVLFLPAILLLSGCLQPDSTQDEQKEPHFMDGKRCANSFDYKGAIEHFQKALEVNPRNASAHFELGVLYDQKEPDPAAAIYHYQAYLRLNPKGPQAELAKSHAYACMQELARSVSFGPVTQPLQAQCEKLMEENKRLREQLEQWKSLANRLQAAATNQPAVVPSQGRPRVEPIPSQTVRTTNTSQPSQTVSSPYHPSIPSATRSAAAPTSSRRSHTVKHGENPAVIARKYGISVQALLAANPGLNPRKMRAGQVLNLP